jgi:hypothetical protein
MNSDDRHADPAAIVQSQLDAYNARDIHAFMKWWAEDARYFEHPSTLLASGAAQIRERHLLRFNDPDLSARLIQRMVVGNKVVDQEVVTRTLPEGKGRPDVIAIHQVEAGRITNVWFIFGSPVFELSR